MSHGAVDGLERVGQLCQFGTAVEVHVAGIGVHSVAHAVAFMLHTKVLNFMALAFQVISQFEYVGFATAVGVEKLVDHQNSHTLFIPLHLILMPATLIFCFLQHKSLFS